MRDLVFSVLFIRVVPSIPGTSTSKLCDGFRRMYLRLAMSPSSRMLNDRKCGFLFHELARASACHRTPHHPRPLAQLTPVPSQAEVRSAARAASMNRRSLDGSLRPGLASTPLDTSTP